jgi:hypothetical protein
MGYDQIEYDLDYGEAKYEAYIMTRWTMRPGLRPRKI